MFAILLFLVSINVALLIIHHQHDNRHGTILNWIGIICAAVGMIATFLWHEI